MTSCVAEGVTYVNDARVVAADVAATNGVMHVIDHVLVPAKYLQEATSRPVIGK